MGSGPAPRRTAAVTAAAAALLAGALPGCSPGSPSATSGSPSATPGARVTTPPASVTPVTPVAPVAPVAPEQVCTELITLWAGRILDAGEGDDAVRLDYQSMGLSGGQNDILRAVVADARAEQRAKGPAAAHELTDREARRRCADHYRSGAPTGGPWQ
ncbi:hypothetical protein [Streptomyces sp. NBC_00096]|uniref:hypothetical protein n=1 Tax=Streptomyces sp. NBC_00096 TaxID=2975650 RepID=UPI003245E0D3